MIRRSLRPLALLLALAAACAVLTPARAEGLTFEATVRAVGPQYEVTMFGVGTARPLAGRMVFAASGFHVEVISQTDVLDCVRTKETLTCTGLFQSSTRPEVRMILTPLSGAAGPQPQSAQLRLDDAPDGSVGTIVDRDFAIDVPPPAVPPPVDVTWDSPSRVTVTWQAQAGAGACLWRARGERPAYQLSCAPGDVTIGPGDAQGGPLAGDVYEVRDRGGAVLAAVALPAYANTAFLPLVVR